MPKKIDKITDEQRAQMPGWVDKWVKVGLSTERAEFDRAEAAVRKAYEFANLPQPKEILRVASPNAVIQELEKRLSGLKEAERKNQLRDALRNFSQGSLWVNWVAYVTFFRDVLGWENDTLEKFAVCEELSLTCGHVWWDSDLAMIVDRPTKILRDEQLRLHGENEAATQYIDGWGVYAWHGTVVPKHIILHPENITEDMIEDETNQEIRRIMIERYGYQKYASSGKLIHEDWAGKLRHKRNKKGDDIYVVFVTNGSKEPDGTYKEYALSVPPDMRTAAQAVAWTYDMSEEDYSKLRKRT